MQDMGDFPALTKAFAQITSIQIYAQLDPVDLVARGGSGDEVMLKPHPACGFFLLISG